MHIEIGQKNFPLMVNAYDKPIISNNGNSALLINGFKDAVEQHINFINPNRSLGRNKKIS